MLRVKSANQINISQNEQPSFLTTQAELESISVFKETNIKKKLSHGPDSHANIQYMYYFDIQIKLQHTARGS